MQQISLKDYIGHQCQLNKESESCLPMLPPQTGKYKRLFHDYRKYLTVNKSNPKTKQFFRSTSAILMERRRQIYTTPQYIIHPFSIFNAYVECIMCILWLYGFLFDPIFVAFYEIESLARPLVIGSLLINTLATLHIILYSITGYQTVKTKEIILGQRQIMIHYLRTYFFFDAIGCIPFRIIATMIDADIDDIFHNMLSAFHLLRIVRINTTFQYLRQITLLLHINDLGHVVITMFIFTFLFLHWISCIVYFGNKILYYATGSIHGYSWLRKLGISAAQDDVPWYRRYIICLHTVILNFYGASIGMEVSYIFSEHIMLSTIMIGGAVYFVYALVVTLQLIRSATTSSSKYEEFLYQLNDYMGAKMLPMDLRNRILVYYEHRFQKKFFREQAILSSLSEHLRHEIFLQSCRHLMEKVTLFRELPKHVVGLILASLKQEVFLPNDIVMQTNTEVGSMYFISYGCVAIYNRSGLECVHLTDGMHFGSTTLISTREQNYSFSCIATEITECYRWDRADFQRCAAAHKIVEEAIVKIQTKTIRHILDIETEIEQARGADILSDLRHNKIIETGPIRRNIHI